MKDLKKEIRLVISSLCGYGRNLDEERAVNGVLGLLEAERKRTLEEVEKKYKKEVEKLKEELGDLRLEFIEYRQDNCEME